MICSLTTKVRKCINVRCITVLVLILQRMDNTKNVTCIFSLRSQLKSIQKESGKILSALLSSTLWVSFK